MPRKIVLPISILFLGLVALAGYWLALSREKLGDVPIPASPGVITVYNERGVVNSLLLVTEITFEVSGNEYGNFGPERLTSYDGFRSFRDDYEGGKWVGPNIVVFSRRAHATANLRAAELVISNTSGRLIRFVRVHSRDLIVVFELAQDETTIVPISIWPEGSMLWVEASGSFDDGTRLSTSGSSFTVNRRSKMDIGRIRITIGPELVEFNQD